MLFPILEQITSGFVIKSIASFDDTLTRIPVISHLTRYREGRIAFSLGTLLALTVILCFAVFFSELLKLIPYPRFITAALIFTLAILVDFDMFSAFTNKRLSKLKKYHPHHLLKIIGVGFIVSFITLLDDAIVLIPLFLGDGLKTVLSIIGVYIAALLQIVIVIYLGERLEKIPYKKELAAFSLGILSLLVFLGIA